MNKSAEVNTKRKKDITCGHHSTATCGESGAATKIAYLLRGTNDSMGGIENDVVKECSGGWVPS